jgi:hypothetical protein
MKVNSLFRKLATELRLAFDQLAGEITHHGLAGSAREDAVKKILGTYLPCRVGVDTGIIVDAHGNESRQIDVVIYDRAAAAVFDIGGIKHFACETVVAAGEIKTRVDSHTDLTIALENIRSAKTLDRSNKGMNQLICGPGIHIPQLGSFDPSKNHRDQILGFIFTGGSLSQDRLISALQEWMHARPRTEWPNLYCDYTRFLISYESESGLTTSAMDAKRMYCTLPEEAEDLLLLFICKLSAFVNEAHVARPNYFSYGSVESTKHLDIPLS